MRFSMSAHGMFPRYSRSRARVIRRGGGNAGGLSSIAARQDSLRCEMNGEPCVAEAGRQGSYWSLYRLGRRWNWRTNLAFLVGDHVLSPQPVKAADPERGQLTPLDHVVDVLS
jgi:hypothetical protein